MKKTMLVMAMVIAMALSTAAVAVADEDLGRQGNNACYGVRGNGGMEFKNPGEMFRYIRDNFGDSPEEWIESRQAETVSEFIYNRCVFHNSALN